MRHLAVLTQLRNCLSVACAQPVRSKANLHSFKKSKLRRVGPPLHAIADLTFDRFEHRLATEFGQLSSLAAGRCRRLVEGRLSLPKRHEVVNKNLAVNCYELMTTRRSGAVEKPSVTSFLLRTMIGRCFVACPAVRRGGKEVMLSDFLYEVSSR